MIHDLTLFGGTVALGILIALIPLVLSKIHEE